MERKDNDAKNRSQKLSITRKVLMTTLIQEMKPVVLVENEYKCREKLLLRGFSWKFRTIKILMQRTKSTVFNLNALLQVLCFRLSS